MAATSQKKCWARAMITTVSVWELRRAVAELFGVHMLL